MSRPAKVALISVGGLLGLIILCVLAVTILARSEWFHAQLQAAATRGMGMQVSLDGALEIGLLPSPNITLHAVRVQNRGVDLGSVDEVYVRFRWLPLLHKDPELVTVLLTNPRLLIKKGTDGILDLMRSTPPVHKRVHGPIEIIATGGTIRYEEATGRAWVEARDCDAKVHDVHTEAPDGRPALQRLSFSSGDLACKTVSAPRFAGTDLKVNAVVPGKGVIDLRSITLQAFGSQASGEFHARLSGDDESYTAALHMQGVEVARVLHDTGFRPLADGRLDLSGDMAYQGRSHQDLLKSVTGDVSLHGSGITLQGYDLDKELTRFERTQRFDFADVLGLFVLDGAGLLATKGYDYASLLKRGGGPSHIHVLVADFKAEQGVVRTQDVAMSTDTHRVAAQGGLDLTTEGFDQVLLALVDAKGCVIAETQLTGSIRKPKLQKPGVLHTLAGPVRRLVDKGKDMFSKDGCTVFYDGSVKPY
jgi:hypothetical protein